MMSLTFGLFTQVSGSGPLGPLVCVFPYRCANDSTPTLYVERMSVSRLVWVINIDGTLCMTLNSRHVGMYNILKF